VTGNQIGIEKTRIDFDLSSCDRERVAAHIARANDIIRSRLPVRKYATTRQALLDDPSLVKLAKGFPEHVTDVHMVEIAGFDIQPCGGTHVDDLAEIGEIVLLDIASKGKNNRRVTFGIR
jgi:misacylated tRNA(Ala) deacylase